MHCTGHMMISINDNNIGIQCSLQNSRAPQWLVKSFRGRKWSEMIWGMLDQWGAWACPPGRCWHRFYLIPTGHKEVSVSKEWEYTCLGIYENYLGNKFWFGPKDKEHIFGREAEWDMVAGGQQWWKKKEAREGNMHCNTKASFLEWMWKSGRG